MIEKDVQITTPDGSMSTFVTCPEEGGQFPVVLFLMDAPDKREELHDMARHGTARQLATVAYYLAMTKNVWFSGVGNYGNRAMRLV